MRILLGLLLVLAVACDATAVPAIPPERVLNALSDAGNACDAGTSQAHSETILWACRRTVDDVTTTTTLRGTTAGVDSMTVRVPRGVGNDIARTTFGSAIAALGLPDAVASAIAQFVNDWEGEAAGAQVGQTTVEGRTDGDELELVVDLAP